MQQILTTFGVDWRLLIINSINFALVLLVLWYFLYTPIMRILNERREKVIQGVKDADEAKIKLEEIEHSRAVVLADAGKEADAVLAHAQKSAADLERERKAASEAAAAHMLKDAEAQSKELKAQAIAQSKQEVAKLIVLGMEKTFQQRA